MASLVENYFAFEEERNKKALEFAEQKIQEEKKRIEKELTQSAENKRAELILDRDAVLDARRDLDEMFSGFITGAVPKAFQTENSNVSIRDPFFQEVKLTKEVKKEPKISPILLIIVGFLVFKTLKKGA